MRLIQDTGGVYVQPKDSVDLASSLSEFVRYLREHMRSRSMPQRPTEMCTGSRCESSGPA